MVGVFIQGAQNRAYEDAARAQIANFETQVKMFRLDVGSFPSTNQGLESLVSQPADLKNPNKWRGPYAEKSIPMDPWGNPFQYELVGPEQVRIWSWGADGADGTEDDVANTQ